MKMKSIFLFLFFALLCACSSDEELTTTAQQPRNALELNVSAGDFVTYGDVPATRAADNGATTTFENGDRVGVIVLEGSNELKGNNLPYLYNGTSWSFESKDNGKSLYYYDSKATSVTYIVYFPYSQDADGVTSIEGLKSRFSPKEDQSSEANYRASDLMTWSSKGSTPQKTLNATLTHAYNSVSILPEVHYTLEDGKNTDFIHPSPAISDVNFSIGNKIVSHHKAADGSYRYILSPDFTGSVRCFYTFKDKTYVKEFTVPSSTPTPVNTRYSSVQKIDMGTYSLDKAQLGDFYCSSSSSNMGYLIPNDRESLPKGTNCIGIVYWLGDIKEDNYGLLDSKFQGDTHGLVVSLWDMPDPDNNGNFAMHWTYGDCEFVSNWLGSATWSEGNNRPGDFTSIQEREKLQGYANTVALGEYNKYIENNTTQGEDYGTTGKKRVKPVKGLAAFQTEHPAPSNSSGWYWPSIYELKYMCWGQDNSQGTAGRDMLNTIIKKRGGETFGDDYWSSTESGGDSTSAQIVHFSDGCIYEGSKRYSRYQYRVRPILAF